MRLSDCRPGQGGTVARICGEGPVAQRLMELGLIAGALVHVIRRAPLGDPLEIRLDRARFSLRASDAGRIELTP